MAATKNDSNPNQILILFLLFVDNIISNKHPFNNYFNCSNSSNQLLGGITDDNRKGSTNR